MSDIVPRLRTLANLAPYASSTRRLHQALHRELWLLIGLNVPFALDDFQRLATALSFPAWAGEEYGEGDYRYAIKAGNLSACRSFEQWKGRTPFLWQGARLSVGAQMFLNESWATVTSFDDPAGTIRLCVYADRTQVPCEACHRSFVTGAPKVRQRFSYTPAQLRAADPSRRRALAKVE